MVQRLQNFGFRESPYDRPNQNWSCGHLADGYECAIGPDAKGHCQAVAECNPARRGERWHCTRSTQHGGRCQEGPGPDGGCGRPIPKCQPVHSHAAKRAATTRWGVVLALAAILLAAGGSWGLRFILPGDLTFHHGDAQNCGDCHSVAEHGPIGWLSAALVDDSSIADAKLCLDCHRLGPNALTAHSLPPQDLADRQANEATASKPALLRFARFIVRPPDSGEAVPCGDCHREHRGRKFSLAEMDDLRCQNCHQAQFPSFTEGHPDLVGYPYRRRTRIAFDHASHIGKHFKEQNDIAAPTSCTSCHVADPGGSAMLVKPFETSCSGCHLDQILGDGRTGPKGFTVLTLPGLDLQTLAEQGRTIGEWPRFADGKLTPLTSLLLARDPNHAEDLFVLLGLDLMDLRGATDVELDAVERVAWSIKTLLYDLTMLGHDGFRERLSDSLNASLNNQQIGHLMGTMPVDALIMLQREWLPNLSAEMAAHRAGRPLPKPQDKAEISAPTTPGPSDTVIDEDLFDDGGGLLDDGDDLLADDDDLFGEGDDLLGDDNDLLGDDESLLGDDDDDLLAGEDDLLSDDDGLLSDDGDALLGADDLLSDEDGIGIAPLNAPSEPSSSEPEMAPVEAENWMRAGGWYRQNYALLYRPIGHADTFLRGWIDLTAEVKPSPGAGQALQIFAELTDRRAPGICGKCHSVDESSDGSLAVNWGTKVRTAEVHRFTRYRHLPHFSLLDETGCLTCHEIDYESDFMASYRRSDPLDFRGNFLPMRKETCAECHASELAGDACTDCHNYHIGLFPPPLRATPLALEAAAAPSENDR